MADLDKETKVFQLSFFSLKAVHILSEDIIRIEMNGKEQIMNGNYVYVGLDLDTTGRRLIDEVSLKMWKNCESLIDSLDLFFARL